MASLITHPGLSGLGMPAEVASESNVRAGERRRLTTELRQVHWPWPCSRCVKALFRLLKLDQNRNRSVDTPGSVTLTRSTPHNGKHSHPSAPSLTGESCAQKNYLRALLHMVARASLRHATALGAFCHQASF